MIKNKIVVIYGDFNNQSANWSTLTSGSEGRILIDFVEDTFLFPSV